jgi:restriction system protein
MNSAAAKQTLQQRTMDIEPEQFENLCKILVEEIENPRDIELTPFGGDGGIDIRGTYGQNFFDTRFGVQVKQYTGTVGTPKMRNFIGALSQHNYQFGCFITSSSFVDNAVGIANDHTIVLVNGDQLTDIMLAHELGITFDGSDYELDPAFWEIFDKTEEGEFVHSEEVPQADSLSVLHICLEAIDKGRRYKPQITSYMVENTDRVEWAARQADYYPLSGYALGYVHKDTIGEHQDQEMRRWGLTRDGVEYLELVRAGEVRHAQENINDHIRNSSVIARILPELRRRGHLTRDELVTLVSEETEVNQTTADRRVTTIGNWLIKLPEVVEGTQGRKKKYEYISDNLTDYVDGS